MNFFCSYPYSGEDLGKTDARMRVIVDTINNTGNHAYCDRFDGSVHKLIDNNDVLGIFKQDFSTIVKQDALLAFVTSPKISIGLIMEVGVAISANMPVYLFEHQSASGSTYLPKLATASYVYKNDNELFEILKTFKPY